MAERIDVTTYVRHAWSDHVLFAWAGDVAHKGNDFLVTGYSDEHRLFMLKLDQSTGALTVDEAFHDSDGRPGFNFDDRDWPQGWKGSANAHGAVFSP